MNRFAFIACFLFGFVLSCDALDLTPHRRVSGVEDATTSYYFQDTSRKMGFRLDPNTSADGSASKVVFQFTDLDSSGMTIAKSPLNAQTPFDGDALKKYLSLAREALPGGATNVVLEKETPDPIAINGWTSHQYVFTCNFYGVSLRRSITFLNFSKKEQWLITISAPVKNYYKTYARSYGILNSIYEMKPGEEFGEPGN